MTASTLPAGRRSPSSPLAARLPDRQLLVRSPPRAGGWGPALDSGSLIRWVVGRLTPSPTGRSLPVEQLHVQVRTWMIGSALPCPAAVLACLLFRFQKKKIVSKKACLLCTVLLVC